MREHIELVQDGLVHFPEYPEEVEQHVHDFISRLEEMGYEPSIGRTRIAMIAPDRRTVIKVPICDRGMGDNNREQRHFIRQRSGNELVKIAACRIFFADKSIGVPMLMMRYVEPLARGEVMPKWADYVDCQQVGRDHTGDIVAYDL